MPCRKEDYIFLEQSVTVDSKEVDALVIKIGEALQLSSQKQSASCGGAAASSSGGAPAHKHGCCMRIRRATNSRANPYNIPNQDWDQMKPWSRKRLAAEQEDRLLTELLRSGTLIQEAVKRLQGCGGDTGDTGAS